MTQKAVLFVRSATNDAPGVDSLRAQEKAGQKYARQNGLKIARTWTVRGRTPLEDRRALRAFVDYVKANSSIKLLLFERPDRISRCLKDLVAIHDLGRELGKEICFFGSDQESTARLQFVLLITLARHELECRREAARKRARLKTDPTEPRDGRA